MLDQFFAEKKMHTIIKQYGGVILKKSARGL